MADEYTISDASFDDLEAIVALEAAAFPAPWKRAFFDSELRAAARYNRIAKTADGRLAGYVFAMHYFDEMHINKIAVVDDMRRRGLATALMHDCIDFARRAGIRTLSLEVRQSNLGAQEFYKRLHFTAVYVRPNYYPDGEAAVVMMAGIAE